MSHLLFGSSTQSNLSSVSVIIPGTAMQKTKGSTVFSTLIMLISTKSIFFLSLGFFSLDCGSSWHSAPSNKWAGSRKILYFRSHSYIIFEQFAPTRQPEWKYVSCKTETVQRCCCFLSLNMLPADHGCFHFSLTLSAKWSRYPSYAAVFWHIYTNWDCDIVTPRGQVWNRDTVPSCSLPNLIWAQGLYLLNASYVLGAITPGVRLGLKIEPAHRQTLGVNDISISEEQDAAFETVALWRKPHILEF